MHNGLYYFYYNQGFTKGTLWVITMGLSIFMGSLFWMI